MLEGIILGTIQGITEWLPISSEAAIVLVKANFFGGEETLTELIGFALFLHLGTFLAATWYLRDDVIALLKMLFHPHRIFQKGLPGQGEIERMARFLLLSTVLSAVVGYLVLAVILPSMERYIMASTKVITGGVGILLLGTAFLQFQAKRKKRSVQKEATGLQDRDSALLGAIQGLTILPGLSRSGLTISALLLRNYSDITALRISFLMSLPAVLGANIFLYVKEGIELNISMIFGALFAFLFGILTIHLLFRIARNVNFAYFVFLFGILTIISVFLQ